ncbi:hypothetical protein B0T10DRAFT_464794 [Thelonectria olida]|uniref:Uncharacterized protein n=1 Tax=Thelonectria olida TaxID=1576542 RepID=A0A9P9AGS1_9HYPO|nr:hypothetical protein B0T10DRAFT_464794 [Thelonectria olida]
MILPLIKLALHLSPEWPFLPNSPSGVVAQFSARESDSPGDIGLVDIQGWNGTEWPAYMDHRQNSSLFIELGGDPDGWTAAHVHKDAGFGGIGHHGVKGLVPSRSEIYMAYNVQFEEVDYGTSIWQWTNNDNTTMGGDPSPASLVFRTDADGHENHTLHLEAQPDPTYLLEKSSVWSQELEMGRNYSFGIVVNTHETEGFIQLYLDGNLTTLTDPFTGNRTQQLAGNFWPGPISSSDPKFGLWGGDNVNCDSYIYDVVIATRFDKMAEIARINDADGTVVLP